MGLPGFEPGSQARLKPDSQVSEADSFSFPLTLFFSSKEKEKGYPKLIC